MYQDQLFSTGLLLSAASLAGAFIFTQIVASPFIRKRLKTCDHTAEPPLDETRTTWTLLQPETETNKSMEDALTCERHCDHCEDIASNAADDDAGNETDESDEPWLDSLFDDVDDSTANMHPVNLDNSSYEATLNLVNFAILAFVVLSSFATIGFAFGFRSGRHITSNAFWENISSSSVDTEACRPNDFLEQNLRTLECELDYVAARLGGITQQSAHVGDGNCDVKNNVGSMRTAVSIIDDIERKLKTQKFKQYSPLAPQTIADMGGIIGILDKLNTAYSNFNDAVEEIEEKSFDDGFEDGWNSAYDEIISSVLITEPQLLGSRYYFTKNKAYIRGFPATLPKGLYQTQGNSHSGSSEAKDAHEGDDTSPPGRGFVHRGPNFERNSLNPAANEL